MLHDMSLTERYAVVFDFPCRLDIEMAMNGSTFPLRWQPGTGSRLGLLPREGEAADVVWVDLPECYSFHPMNAYDDADGNVVIDLVVYDSMFDVFLVGPFEDGLGRLERWTINPTTRTASIDLIDATGQEFPRTRGSLTARPYRYGYAAAVDQSKTEWPTFKHDLQTGERWTFDHGTGRAAGEPVFIGRQGGTDEDDGWLMTYVHDVPTAPPSWSSWTPRTSTVATSPRCPCPSGSPSASTATGSATARCRPPTEPGRPIPTLSAERLTDEPPGRQRRQVSASPMTSAARSAASSVGAMPSRSPKISSSCSPSSGAARRCTGPYWPGRRNGNVTWVLGPHNGCSTISRKCRAWSCSKSSCADGWTTTAAGTPASTSWSTISSAQWSAHQDPRCASIRSCAAWRAVALANDPAHGGSPSTVHSAVHCSSVGVAVDPQMPQIVYGGAPRNVYASAATVFRSTDSGQTFENLTTGDGPHEVAILRVNPQTRDLWLNGQCYGMWRLAAPTQLGAAPVALANAKLSPHLELAQALPDTTPKQLAVNNGDMSAGVGVPDGWGEHWGDVKATRDTTVFHSAPASLRADAGGKSGQAFQMFEVPGGQTYTISGWMKTAGAVKAQVAAQSFAPDWSKNDFNQIRFFQGGSDWTEFSKEVAVPAWAGRFNVQLMVDGEGQAWLDDVKIVAKGAPVMTANTATNVVTTAANVVTTAANVVTTAAKAAPVTATDAAADVVLTNVAVRLGPGNFNYNYGADWKVGENITTGQADGVNFVQLDTTENGGAGSVLNGADLTPQNQTHLALRVRALEGNKAGRINVNLNRSDADGGGKTVTFDLSKLAPNVWTTLVEPLPAGKWDKVQQIQVQGTNWSAGAQPLKIQIAQIGTTSVDEQANQKALLAAVNTPTSGPPTPDKPDVAGWGFWPDYPQAWSAVHRGFLERTAQAREKKDIDVVFLGDSITQGWKDSDEARAIFEALTKPYNAVNYAIGGDSTRQTLYHLQQGVLDGIAPKLAVIMIGTNNLYGDGNAGNDEDIAAGIKKVVATVGQKSPTTKILLLGILPRQNEYFSGRAKHINELIAPLDNGKTVRYLDMSAAFQQSFGVVKSELYVADQLHLAAPGYEVWAAQMKPLFEAMLR